MTRILAVLLAALALAGGLSACKTRFSPADGTEPVITVVSREYDGYNRRGDYVIHLSNGEDVRAREYEYRQCRIGRVYPDCRYGR